MPGQAKKDTTIEEIREIMREVAEAQKKTEQEQQKTEQSLRLLEKTVQETSKYVKETIKALNDTNGKFDNKWGRFMEDLVKGDLINLLVDRKIDVVRVYSRVDYYRPDGTQAGEIDLIAINGKEAVAVEIKTKLTVQDVNDFIQVLNSFKKHFPEKEYAERIIYGGVGYLDDEEGARKYAESKGLFVIKAPGGEAKVSTIVNDKDFKPKEFCKK